MKKKYAALLALLCLSVILLNCLGIGYYSSSSAVLDLKEELTSIYGPEYTGKVVESGREDMTFVVEPKTFFCTNWNFRNAFALPYKYTCAVVFTSYSDNSGRKTRTITYQGIDPMGENNVYNRAHLILSSKQESVNQK